MDAARTALLAQVQALPALTGTITGTLVSGLSGGRILGPDGRLLLGLPAGIVDVTDTLAVQMQPVSFPPGDPRATRQGQPLAFTYALTATHGLGGPPVTRFAQEAVLIWNIDPPALAAAGVSGFPLHVYTYDEGRGYWDEVPSQWNPQTGQLVATTPHFSLYAVGGGFDVVNNYVPTLNDFEVSLQTGAATLKYPLNVPPGPGGFGPQVNLSYSSANVDRVDNTQQGTSSVGWGWSLGTSYIAASQHHWATYEPWTAAIVSAGANGDLVWGNDGTWHTANESYSKVVYNSGPRTSDTWEAWDKGGTHYVFDLPTRMYDAAAGQTGWTNNRWMLHSATDVRGNTITYEYRFEDQSGNLQATPIDPSNGYTRAVYPYRISWGVGSDQV
jgi:hypothetical protein